MSRLKPRPPRTYTERCKVFHSNAELAGRIWAEMYLWFVSVPGLYPLTSLRGQAKIQYTDLITKAVMKS